MAEDGNINITIGKTLSILGQGEFLEPVPNLLHRGHQRYRRGMTEFSTTATESLYQYARDGTRPP
jgi:hypothetical protein